MAESSGETNIPIGDWTTGSLKVYHDAMIAGLKELTDQRFADNYIALIAALTAQEKAVSAALQSTKEAITKAEESNEKRFQAQEKAVGTAFNASKEAIAKSETAVEKRSDAVYVTLSKLSDSLAAVMPRAEAEQRFAGLNEKIDLNNKTLVEKIDNLSTRFERTEGTGIGLNKGWGILLAGLGGIATIIAIISR